MKELIFEIPDELLDHTAVVVPVKSGKELVRCKDCIHRYSICPMITIYQNGSISFRAQDDWFCFMGERKEE